MFGVLILIFLVYSYFIWSFMVEKVDQVNDSLNTFRVAGNQINQAVNQTLQGLPVGRRLREL